MPAPPIPVTPLTPADVVAAVRGAGVGRGEPVAVVVLPAVGLGLAAGSRRWSVPCAAPSDLVAEVERAVRPRWVWWSASAVRALVADGVFVAACWDLAAVHRVLRGGRRSDPAAVWAASHGRPEPPAPSGRHEVSSPPTLLDLARFAEEADLDAGPVGPDGLLRPEWAEETWRRDGWGSPARVLGRAATWAGLALEVHRRQAEAIAALPDPRPEGRTPALATLTARAESAAALLACELERDGLPIDLPTAEAFVASYIGPRPRDSAEEEAIRIRRDAEVLRHFPPDHATEGPGTPSDRPEPGELRSPGQVRRLLRRIGIDVPDTRSGRLEPFRRDHPGVAALLDWRKAERIATTYGYRWLDTAVGPDGRLRGEWSASDGGAGRMTAGANLHNLPAGFRVAVVAEPGHVFVRADLGQIEPRVLAAVSGDRALARATRAGDLYAPVAEQLHCDRPTAKVAVLAAMYGQTSGVAGAALRRMERAYPRAMAYLHAAEEAGSRGIDTRTFGGRLLRVGRRVPATDSDDDAEPSAEVADIPPGQRSMAPTGYGRFVRNGVVQGAAAEFFKAWAATVRVGLAPYAGRIVLCLHDELLVHVRSEHAEAAAALVASALDHTAAVWAAGTGVRFVADIGIVRRWCDAK